MAFDKKYNFKDYEEKIRNFWDENKIYKFDKDSSKPIFSIDTPPPTISGKMHIGHAFSYTHQDFIARYKRMCGNEVYFPFGTDDNGLPTENLVQKAKKVNLRKVDRTTAIKIVLDYLKEERPIFIQDWKNLGMSNDFDLSYSTIDNFSRKISQESFLKLIEMGLIQRRKGPGMWDRKFQTSIAQAELEDVTRKAYLNYVKAKIEGSKNTYLIYATTRPELCFAVVGLSIEETGDYIKLQIGDEFYITGKKTYQEKFKDLDYKIIEEIKGSVLLGRKVEIPVVNKIIEVSTDEAVKADFGTGIAYFCSFGGTEDIEWIKRHGIEPINLLGKDGRLNELAGKYSTLLAEDARKKIIEDMENEKFIIFKELKDQIVNVYDRSKLEVEFIVTNQWYVNYLENKELFYKMAQEFNWSPQFMKHRIENWINGLSWDWGFSRQRHFGVPIPVWYGKKTGKKYYAHKSQLPVDPITDKPKLTKKIYFVRHGEYENNLTKCINIDPNNKLNLTKKGIEQAKKVSTDLAGIKFDKIITSNFQRCIQTAKNIIGARNLNIEQNSILNEMKIGTEADSYQIHDDKIKSQIFENKIIEKDINIKENLEVLKNFLNTLKNSDSENILVVTHKDILRLIEIINENLDLKEFYNMDFKNCQTYLIETPIKIDEELIPEFDVLDTWFTSSSSPIIASNLLGPKMFNKIFPMDLRPQAHDIINNWLFYTMVKSNLIYNKNPFKDVTISGFVLDPKGKKMSKSLGNTISPQLITQKYSNDALRFAAGSTKLGQDIPFQEKEVQTGLKFVNKIYNATKFADMLLKDLRKGDEKINDYENLNSIDKWILAKLQVVIMQSTKAFENYDFSIAKIQFDGFFMRDIADNYIEIVKERLWKPEIVGINETIKAQKALYYSLFSAIKGLAPFMPYICEEVYQKFFSKYENENSIHLTSWPKIETKFENEEIISLGNKFVAIIAQVRKFKSENHLSMKTPLKNLIIECEDNLKEFIKDSINDLKSVTGALEIKFEKAEIKTEFDDVKVSMQIEMN